MVLRNFEDRLERMVEGMFAKAFRSGLQPVEIGRRLVRELDAHRTLDINGATIVPNEFVVRVSTKDHERFVQIQDTLVRELAAAARQHAEDNQLRFRGRVSVAMAEDPELTVGIVRVDAMFNESADPTTSPARLELPDGSDIELHDTVISIGRMTDCDVVLNDPNASRHHAELHPSGDSYSLKDLGSTNGSQVNGHSIDHVVLNDGDVLTFGTVTVRFRLA